MRARHQQSTLKRLSLDILSERKWVLIATVLTCVQVGLTVYLPVLIGQAVDVVIRPNALRNILPILYRMAVVIGLNTIVQWLNPIIYNRLTYRYIASLRQRVMEKLDNLPLAYLDKKSVGDLVSRVTTDTEQLANGLLMVFNQFFIGVLTILVTIFSMADIDLLMLAMVLLLTPLSLFAARFIASRSYTLYQKQTQSRGQVTQYIEEMITQETLLQTYNVQDKSIETFSELNENYANYSKSAIFYSSTVNPTTRFINSLIYALLAGVGALRIIAGAFSVGQLTTFLNYVNQYTKPFNDISAVLSEMQSAIACAERLYLVLDEEENHLPVKRVLDSQTLYGQMSFEHVQFGYDKTKPLIKDVNLDIPAASKVAVVGPTGAGKSTLMNRLAGKKIAVVGNKPGVTKGQQWLKSNKDLEILDTPGILWPKFEDQVVGLKLALTGAIKDNLLPMDEVTIFGLDYFKQHYPDRLAGRFKGITLSESAPEMIMELTQKLGFREDYDRFYALFVKDVRDGKLGRYTLDTLGDTNGDH